MQLISDGKIDVVTFTSGSTVRSFVSEMKENVQLRGKFVSASIGPITSQALREAGLEPGIEAAVYDVDGLIEAIKRYFSGRNGFSQPRHGLTARNDAPPISDGCDSGEIPMGFPTIRLRRLRRTEPLRRLARETELAVADLIYPLFVCPGKDVRKEISSMPGNYQLSPDRLVEECREAADLGIPGVILFGIPSRKDETGSEGYDPEGIVQTAVRQVKEACPDLLVVTDVCLCEYTSHGHCGLVGGEEILNDPTLELLAKTSAFSC